MYQFHYVRRINDIREEKIPWYCKKLKANPFSYQFDKPTSVFADWREDDKKILAACFIHDEKYSKIKRMLAKDQS